VSSRVIPFPVSGAVPGEHCAVSPPASLHDAVAFWRRRHRTLIAEAGAWALARGLSIPANHVALLAATLAGLGCHCDLDGTGGPWRASTLPGVVANLAAWCTSAGCPVPPGVAESLWHLIGFLAETGRLHPASDSLTELRASLVVFGTFDRSRPSPPPEPTAA
jgi:hypothetical protein